MGEVTQFKKGKSGNRIGRPKGSKNKITLLKLMGEEAFREGNTQRMLNICEKVLEDAENGDFRCMKLVWDSMISKEMGDTSKAQVKPQITIVAAATQEPPKAEIIEAEEAETIENEEQDSGE